MQTGPRDCIQTSICPTVSELIYFRTPDYVYNMKCIFIVESFWQAMKRSIDSLALAFIAILFFY